MPRGRPSNKDKTANKAKTPKEEVLTEGGVIEDPKVVVVSPAGEEAIVPIDLTTSQTPTISIEGVGNVDLEKSVDNAVRKFLDRPYELDFAKQQIERCSIIIYSGLDKAYGGNFERSRAEWAKYYIEVFNGNLSIERPDIERYD